MAQTESRIRLIFDGSERGVVAAAAKSAAAIRGLNDENSKLAKFADKAGSGLLTISKGMAALGAAGSAVNTVGAVAGALTQLAPAALLLPGALLGGAAAMGTFKLATAGMGDALKAGLSGDLAKFTEATKDMAPAMQDAAKSVAAFKPQVDTLRKTVQGNFWAGFNTGIEQLGNNYLPILQKRLPDIATQFNLVGRGIFEAFNSRDVISDFDSLLGNVAKSMTGLGPAVGNVGAGIVKLAELGSRRFAGLGEAVDSVALKFRNWVSEGVESGSLDKLIDGAIRGFQDLGAIVKNVGSILGSVFTGLGGQISSPLASLRELTGQVAAFLKTVEAQEGLKALGDTLRVIGDVVGRVVMTAFRELAPTLVAIAPTAKVVATTLGDLLVSALETLGPVIRGVADVLADFPSVVSLATVGVVGFVAAIKTVKAVNAVTELLGLESVFTRVGASAEGAGGKVGAFGGKLSALKGAGGAAGVAVAIGAVAFAIDDLNIKAAGSAAKLDGIAVNLHQFRETVGKIFSGDIGLGRIVDQAKAAAMGIQNALSGVKLTPINFEVNTGPGRTQVRTLLNEINGAAPTVNINGNINGAAFAYRQILAEIAQGKAEIIIDGQPVPAQEALARVKSLIDTSVGNVQINGETVPASRALDTILKQVNSSTATATFNANGAPALETVGGWTRAAEGTVGVASLDANKAPADGKTGEWVGGVSRTRGVATLDANGAPANQQVAGWQGRANATTGTSKLNANPGQANAETTGWKGRADGTTGTAKINANASSANSVLQGLKNAWDNTVITVKAVLQKIGFASGGPVFPIPGLAGGGSVIGRGTGTSDSIPAMLSNGEHVLTAREVQAAGGHAAIFALRKSLMRGRVPRMSAVGGRAATGGAVSAATGMPTPEVSVAVFLGDQQIRDMVRTEINHSSRATRRTVSAGAGASF